MNSADIKRILRRAYGLFRLALTYWKKELIIRKDELELTFATTSPITKRWFYPRYGNGQRLHEPPVARLIASRLTRSSTFYDIGANLGFFTVLAMQVCDGPEGSVHAFEMDPKLIPLIRESVDKNRSAGSVYLTCVACSDEVGSFVHFMADQDRNPSTNRIRKTSLGLAARSLVQVPTTTIDHYWNHTDATPDLIKIDIEGAEALAVPHMRDLVTAHAPEIVLEVHPIKMDSFGVDPLRLVDQLREAGGYTVFEIDAYRTLRAPAEAALHPLTTERLSRTDPTVLFFTRDETLADTVSAADQ